MSTASNVIPIRAGLDPQPPPDLGRCEWCHAADAVCRVEVVAAKNVKRPLQPHEREIVIKACGDCRGIVERQKAAAAGRKETALREKRERKSTRRRS